jgi:TRAP-type C4-dicarboxylate transport system substrate-binding protein
MDRIWDNGFRQITSSVKAISGPDDLRNFKIRAPVSPLWTSLFQAFGASPTSINFSETYSALQTRVVDGQENLLTVISTVKLYEVQKFCSVTNHMWDGFWMLANRRAWSALPADAQSIVAKNWNAAAVSERADVAKLNAGLRDDLSEQGLAFNQPGSAPFRDALKKAGFYGQWNSRYGDEAWKILEQSSGSLT